MMTMESSGILDRLYGDDIDFVENIPMQTVGNIVSFVYAPLD